MVAAVHYLEKRERSHDAPESVVADIMRYFHARQYIGKAVVVCDQPDELMALAHKQWLRLSRVLQRRRHAATEPDEILRHTYTITHMQQVRLTAQPMGSLAEADIYFVRPQEASLLPNNCLTLFFATKMTRAYLERLLAALPPSGLIVDYYDQLSDHDGLHPKIELEAKVRSIWRTVESFLLQFEITLPGLETEGTEELDDALDKLLEVGNEWLHLAVSFQYALNLARPLQTIAKMERTRYESLLSLAHQVQMLTPGALPAQFLKTYADDSFFLNDVRYEDLSYLGEAVARHLEAGRYHLATALRQWAENRSTFTLKTASL